MTDEERKEFFDYFIRMRGVETPCPRCQGLGTKTYGSTSTWRGGMGGSACTKDVCDECWGSGDKFRHGDDLRALRNTMAEQIHKEAAELFVSSVGANLSSTKPAIEAIIIELEKLSNGRKERPMFFYDLCLSLAKTFRKAIS